jgi:uncharacterized membrane-anchored protein
MTKIDLHSTYTWFGAAGNGTWDFEIEPFGLLFGIAGAIIVVCAGLYMRRNVGAPAAEAAASH